VIIMTMMRVMWGGDEDRDDYDEDEEGEQGQGIYLQQ